MRELRPESPVYHIEKRMGQGQSATVFRAIRRDSRGHSEQMVALKILTGRTTVSWLQREFAVLARVDSPHCVRVLGWENLKQGPALVLEWIDGVDLFQFARHSSLTSHEITEIIAQAKCGLKALHSLGLFHGDLSPANILIDRSGRVRLIDFATAPHEKSALTGTPAYLAPERWSGHPACASADLFALGLIEFDLTHQFHRTPHENADCQARASFLANHDSCLLHPDPEQRELDANQSHSTGAAREKLAASVTAFMDQRPPAVLHTAVIPRATSSPPRFHHLAYSICAWILITALPGRAQAPLVEAHLPPGHLSVRSLRWYDLSLNGRHVGFAPLDHLSLHSGRHHLAWKSATGHGQRWIELKSGQDLRLSESDLHDGNELE